MIQSLSHYWWAYLAATVVFYGLIIVNQLRRMERLVSLQDMGFKSFFMGMGFLIVYALAGTVSGVLFLIGVVVAIMNASK